MKLDRIKRRSGGSLVLDITPLIDVVFLLLIFFLTATTFEDASSGIKIELPTSTIKEIKDIKEVQLIVTKEKKVVLFYKDKEGSKSEEIAVANLKAALAPKVQNSENQNVLISADKDVDYGFIVELMTIAKDAGAASLDIDTASVKK